MKKFLSVILLFIVSFTSLNLLVFSIFDVIDICYLIPCMLSSMLTYLWGSILFYKKTNTFPKNEISEYYIYNIRKLLIKDIGFQYICFVKKGHFWVCENNQQIIKLDLNGYIFPKSYLVSYVVRNLRYPFIREKLPFKYLFKNSLYLNKSINIKLLLIDGSNKTEKIIVKNGISKYGFLAKHITISPFYPTMMSNRSYQAFMRNKSYIDEKRYKNYYIK